VLEEDPSVNRLVRFFSVFGSRGAVESLVKLQEDSILLWKSIVSNQLLKNTETVLFLNKIDIMRGT
jgi:guanine nucleotide-binding protein subunit alpha